MVEKNDEKIRGFKHGFIITIGMGGEKRCIIGTKWWCMCEKEYPLK
jgi:hypothetical protein